jgi:hypothetical protein
MGMGAEIFNLRFSGSAITNRGTRHLSKKSASKKPQINRLFTCAKIV